MSIEIDWGLYLNSPDAAARELGRLLHQGEIALLVGAGISLDFGAPSWHALARLMAREARIESAGINRKKLQGDSLADLFSRIERSNSAEFTSRVKKWLYHRWTKTALAPEGNWASHTLAALGALMSSTIRGRIDTVLSLNFDSILEMYLRLYGFIVQPVASFSTILTRADVRVFHSHGYLPLDPQDGSDSEILLTKHAYLEAIGDDSDPRRRMMEYVFAQRRILAIGVSGDDVYSRSIFAALAKRYPGRLLGFWITGPRVSTDRINDLKASNLVTVRLSSFKNLPEFLLSIARYASKLTLVKPPLP